jgi:hypothetical protein
MARRLVTPTGVCHHALQQKIYNPVIAGFSRAKALFQSARFI